MFVITGIQKPKILVYKESGIVFCKMTIDTDDVNKLLIY